MEKLLVTGGQKLSGTVSVSGAKNAALAILPATLLCKDVSIIENVPNVSDIRILLEAMVELGAKVQYIDINTIKIDTTKIDDVHVSYEKISKIRASYYLIGALLGRCGEAQVALPGGCNIGNRPIDQHIKGFEALGADVEIEHGMVNTKAEKLKGADIFLDVVSVGATINIMLAATKAEGHSVIENPAKEPHIVDVANFLNSMGADIKGAGTDLIKINGVKELHGAEYMIIPDQIEAGTYMIAGAITKGDVTVKNLIPKHMEAISAKLKEVGVGIEEFDDSIRVYYANPYKSVRVKTLPYPGFPTDMQPQMTALLSTVQGASNMTEGVWQNRFQYIDELNRMGTDIHVEGNTATIVGVDKMTGAEVTSTDLRAGAALVLAGLVAEGDTLVNHVDYIDRGYEHIEDKLRGLGAKVFRISDDDPKKHLKIV